MITREGFNVSFPRNYEELRALEDNIEQLLKERDAYREVANKYRALWVSEGRYSDDSVASQVIDAEAARIVAEGEGKV